MSKPPDRPTTFVIDSQMRHNLSLGKIITEKGLYENNKDGLEYAMHVFRQCLNAELEKLRAADADLSNKTYNRILEKLHITRIQLNPYTHFIPANLHRIAHEVYIENGNQDWRDFILGLTARWLMSMGNVQATSIFNSFSESLAMTVSDEYLPEALRKDFVSTPGLILRPLINAPIFGTYLLIWALDAKDFYVFEFNENIKEKAEAVASNPAN